jgi:hypothetical protein
MWVTSVRTRSEDRTSISSHPLADLGWKLLIGVTSSLAPHIAQFLCSSQGPFLRPGPQTSIASRAGAVKAGRRAWLAAGSGVARRRLDRAEHGARISRRQPKLLDQQATNRLRIGAKRTRPKNANTSGDIRLRTEAPPAMATASEVGRGCVSRHSRA